MSGQLARFQLLSDACIQFLVIYALQVLEFVALQEMVKMSMLTIRRTYDCN